MLAGWTLAAALLCGPSAEPARAETTLYRPPTCSEGELRSAAPLTLLACYAPLFVVQGSELRHNRIGSPVAQRGWFGSKRIRVDAERPALYAELQRDTVAGRPLLQLVYRVHFEKIPLRLSRYFFEAHRNPGLLLIITLDEATRAPWFVTAVHTCGCYMALIPTQNMPSEWLPNDWPQRELRVYGQRLAARLPDFDPRSRRLQAQIAAQSHRFTSLSVTSTGEAESAADAGGGSAARIEELPLLPLSALRTLALPAADQSVSMFYGSGPLRGHVRGAWNPLEGLTLFGLLSLDPTVGMDKDFGDPRETGTPFYTQLPFWLHGRSRLDRLEPLLRLLGFQLPATGESGAH